MDSVTSSVVVCADVMGSVVPAAVDATSVVVPVVELSGIIVPVTLVVTEVVVEVVCPVLGAPVVPSIVVVV